jgi:hypothetical protein
MPNQSGHTEPVDLVTRQTDDEHLEQASHNDPLGLDREAQWESCRGRVFQLYLVENKTAKQVRDILQLERGLKSTFVHNHSTTSADND